MTRKEIDSLLNEAQNQVFQEYKEILDPAKYDATEDGQAKFFADFAGMLFEMSGKLTVRVLEKIGVLQISD